MSQDLIFSPSEIWLPVLEGDYVKLKVLVKIYFNCLQSQIAFYITTSLKEAESLWRCKFLSYKVFPAFWQPKGSFHISFVNYISSISCLQNICRQATICFLICMLFLTTFSQYVAQYWQGEQKMALLTLQFIHFLFIAKLYIPMSKLKQILFCNAPLITPLQLCK
jgi:hypothetical protein